MNDSENDYLQDQFNDMSQHSSGKVRSYLLLMMAICLQLVACQDPASKDEVTKPKQEKKAANFYQEKQLSFFHLRNGYKPGMDWIKDPKVLFMVHESLHKIGYNYLNEHFLLSDFVDISMPQVQWVDSLELTYENYLQAPKYYREFWQRRVADGNDEVVYRIVEEIASTLVDGGEYEFFPELVNDTLVDLLTMELPLPDRPAIDPNEDIQKLLDYGLHQSAYNVLTGQRANYSEFKWDLNVDSLLASLKKSSDPQPAWLGDDTK